MPKKKKQSTLEITRARVLSQRRKMKLTQFKTEEKAICRRVAAFLAWCAAKYPYQIITYEEVTQAIFDLSRIPTAGSRHVKSVRGQMSSTGKILMDGYKNTLITMRGIGVRASVDDSDILRYSVTKEADRHRQTGKKLTETAALVSPEKLKAQTEGLKGDSVLREEMIQLSAWLTESVSKYVKTLQKPSMAAALLPPPPEA